MNFEPMPTDELPYKEIPLHTVYKLMPMAYDCKLEEIHIPPSPDADTYFPRPTVGAGVWGSTGFQRTFGV